MEKTARRGRAGYDFRSKSFNLSFASAFNADLGTTFAVTAFCCVCNEAYAHLKNKTLCSAAKNFSVIGV
jgi:hypothetical protein